MDSRLKFALAGAGGRGGMFASWILSHYGPGALVAVAEPNETKRNRIVEAHRIPAEGIFSSWQEMLAGERLADVLIDTTMDREHLGSACAAMRLGYHMLLEKPLATNLADSAAIDDVRRETGRIVSVCHSLRYNSVYERARELIDSGTIGDVVSLDQLEAVEHTHQAHSFVRGNWANESRSTFMLLAKSCHDLDVIDWLIDQPCRRVASYGGLKHFRKENAPTGAPAFCVEGCPAEDSCPYHALKVYGPKGAWRGSGGFSDLSAQETIEQLRHSRFGRCVYQTDNDVVDHQVVAMEFDRGITATFTMTAFTPWGGRYVRVHGTKGYLEVKVDQRTIDLWEFWKGNRHTLFEIAPDDGGHGGGDDRLMKDLILAVTRTDASRVRTSTSESLRTHRLVFASELSRRLGRMIELADLDELEVAYPLSPQSQAV